MNMMNKKIMNMIEFEIGHGDGHDHGDDGGDGVDDDSYGTNHNDEDDFICFAARTTPRSPNVGGHACLPMFDL